MIDCVTPPRRPSTPDQVDEAVAQVEQQNARIPMATVDVQLPSGRQARLIVPVPLTTQDVGAMAGILAEVVVQTLVNQTPEQMAAAVARSRLVLPT